MPEPAVPGHSSVTGVPENIERGVTVVFSSEKRQVKEQTGVGLPSGAPVVGAFGCAVTAAALDLLR